MTQSFRFSRKACLLALPIAGVALSAAAAKTGDAAAGPATVPSPASIIAAMPKNLPRAVGPSLDAAIDAAKAAHAACVAKNVKVSVLIADSVGEPVVLLSGDGAGVRSQLIARTKVAIVARYKMSSNDVIERAKTDPTLDTQAAADPNIGVLRGGGYPVMKNGAMIGIVGVSGGSLGGVMGLDEMCAQVAVAKLEAR